MNLYEKLLVIKESVNYLKKETKGEQYNFVSSSQTLASVRDSMNKNKVLLIPAITGKEVLVSTVENKVGDKLKKTNTYFTELTMTMTWLNVEQPKEVLTCPWYGQGVDIAGEKGVGKALTYAEKYFILKFFNIPTDKDDPDTFQKKTEEANETPEEKEKKKKLAEAKKEKNYFLTLFKYHKEEIKTCTDPAKITDILDNVKKTRMPDEGKDKLSVIAYNRIDELKNANNTDKPDTTVEPTDREKEKQGKEHVYFANLFKSRVEMIDVCTDPKEIIEILDDIKKSGMPGPGKDKLSVIAYNRIDLLKSQGDNNVQ